MKSLAFLTFLASSSLALHAGDAVTLADFTRPDHHWTPTSHVRGGHNTPAGLAFDVVGEDPWLVGPAMTFPALPAGAKRITFSFTCAPTTRQDTWQLFYTFGKKPFNEGDSIRLAPVGKPPYTRFTAEAPASIVTTNACRFRLDPPGGSNTYTVTSLSVSFISPIWTYTPQPQPPLVIPASTPYILKGKDWELRHDPHRLGAFRFLSRGKTVENAPAEPFVYLDKSGKVRTLDWDTAPLEVEPPSPAHPDELITSSSLTDADGRLWQLCRRFKSLRCGKVLTISTHIGFGSPASQETASVLHLPYLTLFVDRASQGLKHQALLAGVEYLDNEPSSNEKEIRTLEHNRLIPAPYRLSAPFAAFTDDANWLSATWDRFNEGFTSSPLPRPAEYAAVFDTPDRLFASGGHLLAFWAPAVGPCRRESELDIYTPFSFKKGTHVVTLRTGAGNTVADALSHIQPGWLPPADQVDPVATLELLAHGWLDSALRRGTQVSHAVGGPFKPATVADAPILMQYLAAALSRQPKADKALIARLQSTAAEMLKTIPVHTIGHSGVSHIRLPAPVLVAGDVKGWLNQRAQALRDISRRLASGKRIWRKPNDKKSDLGETLGADHCNGFTAMELTPMLGAATWSGDDAEIKKALDILDKFTALYHGTVPRGAQPWEMPLHTPDILASAHIVHAYMFAYALCPDPAYLREARHWAFTGLSMVYFTPPPYAYEKGFDPVGRYATCGVMGATHWASPNWIGRPVQWCGLVYANALWDLARQDRDFCHGESFWNLIATGITTSGVRQSHTAEDPQNIGLLPDSWNLAEQTRNPVPINPGTVQENYAECIGLPFYSLRALGDGTLIHVPGNATRVPTKDGSLRCTIDGWPQAPFKVCLTHVEQPASVTFKGADVPFEFVPAHRALIVTLPASAAGELAVTLPR